MNFQEFETRLEEVRASRAGAAGEFALFESVIATSADLERVEAELRVSLPAVYKDFLRRLGGGSFLFLDLLPAVAPDDSDEDLLTVNTGEWKIPDFIAIAPVGTGDWWGFRVAHENRCSDAVYLWSHDDGELIPESADFLDFVAAKGLSKD